MIRKQGLLPIFLALGLSALFSHWVAADDHGTGPCADDVKKFCGDVKPGHKSVVKCMMEHQAELSPTCKEHHTKMKAEIKDLKEACKEDNEKFCKDAPGGRGRIMKCLMQHEADLSPNCKKEIAEMKAMRHQK